MQIGIPREIKVKEGRVGLIPAACATLVEAGHEVFVEHDAGLLSGYPDEMFRSVGVNILPDAGALYEKAKLIVKVKEPIEPELGLLRAHHLLFSYLHLAAEPALTEKLLDIGLIGVAFETVQAGDGLPLLAPMSNIAGRVAAQVGSHLLHQPQDGKGLLLGGVPGAERGKVVVIGAGVAGGNAAMVAANLGAQVSVFDKNLTKLEHMRALGPNVTGLYPYPTALMEAVCEADLVIGAVLVTGARAPHVVDRKTVQQMNQGSVIADISVDQGGCIETTRPTTYADPTYLEEGVVHFCVTNMPGAVPKTASQALSASLVPYVLRIAQADWRHDSVLQTGINVDAGKLVHPALLNV